MKSQPTLRGRGSKPINNLAEYENFQKRLTTKYLVTTSLTSMSEVLFKLGAISSDLSMQDTEARQVLAYALSIFCCFSLCYFYTRTRFEVPQNHFALVASDSGKAKSTLIYGPGFHMLGRYNKLISLYNLANMKAEMITSPVGDLIICIVEQGTITHFTLAGQNIYLGPGLHKITDPVIYKGHISLGTFLIDCGSEKWVTIPDNYSGVILELGLVKILEGGKQHHLEHIGKKFVCLVPRFVQTDIVPTDIDKYLMSKQSTANTLQTTRDPSFLLKSLTSDGSVVWLDTNTVWKIVDVEKAVKNAMMMMKLSDEANDAQLSNQLLISLRKIILNIIKSYITVLVAKNTLFKKDSDDNDERTESEIPQQQSIFEEETLNESSDEANISHDLMIPKRQTSYELNVKSNALNDRNTNIDIRNDEENIVLLRVNSGSDNPFKEKKPSKGNKLQINNFIEREEKAPLISSNPAEKEEKKLKDAKSFSYDFLGSLQRNQPALLRVCNKELKKIGATCETLAIQNVLLDEGVQERFDLQTKARVDLNTAIIELESRKQKTQIETQMRNENVLRKAEANKEALLIKSQGESDTISTLAQARRKEAEELNLSEIAQNLAKLRLNSEIGHTLFSANNSQFVFRGPKLTDYIK